jgi:hypothetical protein
MIRATKQRRCNGSLDNRRRAGRRAMIELLKNFAAKGAGNKSRL